MESTYIKRGRQVAIMLILLMFCASCRPQPFVSTGLVSIEGKLTLMPWAKSMESYCAGGSDYWIIEKKFGDATIVKPHKVGGDQSWKALEGKVVQASGVFKTIERPLSNEKPSSGDSTQMESQKPISQMPVGSEDGVSTVECTYFEVVSCQEKD